MCRRILVGYEAGVWFGQFGKNSWSGSANIRFGQPLQKPLYFRSGQLLCVAKYELPTSAKEENYGLSHGLVYRVVKQSAEEEGVV
jgi:hypothetical protein